MSNQILKKKLSLQELDVLRGIAALFMVINHGGYALLNPDLINHGITAIILFISSFAPVLFFLATGLGYGLQINQPIKSNYWFHVFYKVIILIMADQFFWWQKGTWIGLNFLGFIGFSTLIMAKIRVLKRSCLYSIIGLCLVSILRYGIGPYLQNSNIKLEGIISWVIGTQAISNISYPLSPWLAYPFLGYILGASVVKYYEKLQVDRLNIALKLLLFSILPMILSGLLWYKKSSFFRWSTVSLGFYILSFSIISVILAISLLIKINSSMMILQNILSLRGISSLAVVPIHYSLISVAEFFKINNLGLVAYIGIVPVICILSFFLARQVEVLGYWLYQSQRKRSLILFIIMILCFSTILTISYSSYSSTNSLVSTLSSSFGQILLCFLLIVHRT